MRLLSIRAAHAVHSHAIPVHSRHDNGARAFIPKLELLTTARVCDCAGVHAILVVVAVVYLARSFLFSIEPQR